MSVTDQQYERFPEEFLELEKGNPTDEKLIVAYKVWSKTHDLDAVKYNYVGHKSVAERFDAILSTEHCRQLRENLKVIDLGCGTGLLGIELAARGFTRVDGLDISEDMLEIARNRNIYNKLFCCRIRDALSKGLQAEEYDAVLSSGLFALGCVQPNEIDVLFELLKPGGNFCSTFRMDEYKSSKYASYEKFQDLVNRKKLELISEETAGYCESSDLQKKYGIDKCYVIVYKKL